VKLAPAVPWDDLRPYDAEVEFLSVAGELKECVLWFGPLRSTGRRATLLTSQGPATLSADTPAPAVPPGPPQGWLYDPDPAITRAGLVSDLAHQLAARPIDGHLAYLTGETPRATPFARVYAVEAALPFQARRLAEYLRAHRIGQVDFLRRGSAIDPEALRKQLHLTGSERRVVVLTAVQGQPYALIGRCWNDQVTG
jgi:hypothetical protein